MTSSVDKSRAGKVAYLDTSKVSDSLTQYLSSRNEEIWTALVNSEVDEKLAGLSGVSNIPRGHWSKGVQQTGGGG